MFVLLIVQTSHRQFGDAPASPFVRTTHAMPFDHGVGHVIVASPDDVVTVSEPTCQLYSPMSDGTVPYADPDESSSL